jgi:opacity protein-like surface antigen
VTYLIPGWSVGFGGNPIAGGSLPGFDGSDARGRYNFSNGWFVGGEGGGTGLSMNGINQAGAFGDPRSLSYQGVQFGYNFQNVGRPLSVYAGFDTLKYNPGIGGPFAPFDTTSGTVPGYSAHAGVEFQPTSNVSLSLGFGYTQQSGRIDSDFNSLPGVSPFALRR